MGRYELTDSEWKAIERCLPNKPRGVPRVDDRRVLNGIFWVLRSGARWADLPERYGPPTTIYNRFNRWSGRGIWQQIFETVAGAPEPPEQVALDSTHVKAHRCAGGGKGGPPNRRSASPEAAATASCTRSSINYADHG